jgi:hypothetical protein
MKRTRYVIPCIGLVAALVAATALRAADVSMTANDGIGTSSFNGAGTWSDALAPSAGNNYFNATYLLRTPTGNGSYTFAGDALTITGSGLAAAANNEALMWKGSGTGAIITVNNLTVNGGQLRHGSGTADSFTLAGGLTIGVNGANMAAQGGMTIGSVSGQGTIRILANGNGDPLRIVRFGGSGNSFTGDIELYNATQSYFELAAFANLNFEIGASGVNNKIFGVGVASLNGDFNIDLTGAGTTSGDSWRLVDTSTITETFGSTFTVTGFTDLGSGLWLRNENGVDYYFAEDTGILNVPEPGTSVLLLAGLGMLLGCRRLRKA